MKKALFCAKTLSAVIILSLVLNLFGITAFASKHSVGDLIQFGSYPQTLCDDEDIISQLDKIDKNWKYYDYYGGNGDYGSMKKSEGYSYYADVSYGGKKYRAVYIEEYRPALTTGTSEDSNQANANFLTDARSEGMNGDNMLGYIFKYKIALEKVYYFEYEPIWWQVLDPSTGFVVSCDILDAQPFCNTLYWRDNNGDGEDGVSDYETSFDEDAYYEFFGDKSCSSYANNWENSSIREWLNDDFYNTAFSNSEKLAVQYTSVDNTNIIELMTDHMTLSITTETDIKVAGEYSCGYTTDQIFLLAADEIITEKYGFEHYAVSTRYSETRCPDGISDYAECQGVGLDSTGDASTLLRSPKVGNSNYVYTVDGSGDFSYTNSNYTGNGIRPAMNVDLSSLTAYSGGDGSYSDDDGGYINSDNDYNSNDNYYEDNDSYNNDEYDKNTNNSFYSNEDDIIALSLCVGFIVIVVVIFIILKCRKNKALSKSNNIYPHSNQNNVQLFDNPYFNDLFNDLNNNKPK